MIKSVLTCQIIFTFFLIDTLQGSRISNEIPPLSPFMHVKEASNWETLDDNGQILLAWTVDTASETITFELEAETLGYIGIGISPTGSMNGADIFIAGVYDNGTTYHSDRYATGFSEPLVDDHQDWTLLEAREFVGVMYNRTYLKFSRLINTCDDQDYPIGVDTTRLIWAMGSSDTIEYHTSSRRGTRSVNLLGAKMPEVDLGQMMEWKVTLDMVMPKNDTSYWCSLHKGPKLDKTHHIVAFDAFLPDENALAHTHHFILYNCYNPIDDSPIEDHIGNYTVDKGYLGDQCFLPFDPENEKPVDYLKFYCQEYFYVWAKGGKKLVFPENVGYPIGDANQAGRESFYMLEVHYDNPDEKDTVRFETGVKFYYTDQTREHDAGQIMIGHEVSPALTIPPNTADFVTVGHCASACTADRLPTDGIKVFNTLLHSHLSGRKLKLRHFRDNQELPWLDYDDHYDFDYQQNKHLNQEVVVMPGDHITYECTYDSMWKNGEVVIGELSTRDEMCEAFLWYYPRIQNLDICRSTYNLNQSFADLGITNYTMLSAVGNPKIWINQPLSLEGDYENSMAHKFNWSEEFKQEMELKRRTSMHDGLCFGRMEDSQFPEFLITYPEIDKPYQPENVCAANSDPTVPTTTGQPGSAISIVVSPLLIILTTLFLIFQ